MEQRTLTPDQALALMNPSVDGKVMLSGFAEAGLIKSYARWCETTHHGSKPAVTRGSKVPDHLWGRIIAEASLSMVWATHEAMLAGDDLPGGRPKVRLRGIRFDEATTIEAARQHGGIVPEELRAQSNRVKPAPAKRQKKDAITPDLSSSAEPELSAFPDPAQPMTRSKPSPDINAPTFTVDEALYLLKIGKTKFYNMVSAKHLKITKIGSKTVVAGDSVRQVLRGGQSTTTDC